MSCSLFYRGSLFTPSTLLVTLLLIHLAAGLKDLDVFRLIAYEEDGITYGSKTPALDSPGAHYLATFIQRKLALIRFHEITSEVLTNLIDKGVAGILVLMPENLD